MSYVPPNIVVNWTAAVDNRSTPATIAFFVELSGDHDTHGTSRVDSPADGPCAPLPDLALARDRVFDELLRSNENLAWDFGLHRFRKPTFRLVRAGTFSEFLQMKLDEGSRNVGQVKVPVVLPKPEYVTWFSERVMQEL